MAQRARFGRLPRAAPSLTSTIVALAQEYQRVRESNIVDAWKNGGMFEGKRVTDQMILKWFKDRRGELSSDDPMWDFYNNQVSEYEFAIANSKMELEYKRGNASDGEMAAFYHKWAGKLPTYSEAYREREKLAAAYSDRAASGRAASGRARNDRAYANEVNKSFRKEFTYDATLAFLTNEAINRGILRANEDLSNIDPNTADGREINRLWDEIANSPEYADERKFYGDQIRKNGNPNFNGDFSQDAFNGYTRVKSAGVDDRITAARKAGRQGDVNSATKDRDGVRGMSIITGGFDETELYESARKEWISTFTNPNATPLMIDRANQKYTAELNRIKDSLQAGLRTGEVDPRLGAINNELRTMAGDEAPLEHWGGMFGPGGNEGVSDASETAAYIKQNLLDIENLSERDSNGDPLFVLAKTVDGVPVNTTTVNHAGVQWGVVRREQLDENTVFVVQNDYGDPRAGKVVTAVVPTPIFVASDIKDPETGEIKTQRGDKAAAYNYTLPDGKVIYKYQDAAGKWLYTPDNPFGQTTTNPDGSVTQSDIPPTIDSKGGVVKITGGGNTIPQGSEVFKTQYYAPGANDAMTSRVANSGYSAWLMASDPKDTAAYSASGDDIITSLRLESGGDTARLAAMVVEADQRRAIYLGNSDEERYRVRKNYLLGNPNPVPLASVLKGMGVAEGSAEARAIAALTAGGETQVVEDIREANAARNALARGGPEANNPSVETALRKYDMVAPPPKPLAEPKQAPTSMGPDIPSTIASNLGGLIQNLFGQRPLSPAAQIRAGGPKPAGPGSSAYGAGLAPPKPTGPPAPPAPPKTPPKVYAPPPVQLTQAQIKARQQQAPGTSGLFGPGHGN